MKQFNNIFYNWVIEESKVNDWTKMKYIFAAIALFGSSTVMSSKLTNKLGLRDLTQSSLVLLEAAIPAPQTLA